MSRRLSLLITDLDYGGREIQVVQLALQFQNSGWAVQVISMLAPRAFVQELRSASVKVESLNMQRGVANPFVLFKLARFINQWNPDILHSHLVHANLLARAVRPLLKVPVLISTAGNINEGHRWREIVYRLSDPWCDLTTNVSELATTRYIEAGVAPEHKIVCIPNCINTERFSPNLVSRDYLRQELGIEDQFIWLAVGRLEKQKDYPNLLRAFHDVVSAYSKSALLICGKGTLKSKVENLVAELSLQSKVHLLGVRQDIPQLMNAADGYVMSSAWEGMPGVLLEASATELPIVATDVGGNREVVIDGKNGFLVAAQNHTALANTMHKLMQLSKRELLQMGKSGRQFCLDKYSLEAGIERWKQLYLDMLSAKESV